MTNKVIEMVKSKARMIRSDSSTARKNERGARLAILAESLDTDGELVPKSTQAFMVNAPLLFAAMQHHLHDKFELSSALTKNVQF